MAEFRIKRLDVVKYAPCKDGLELFDLRVQQQGHGEPDLIFPDGWTELHSVMMYQTQPRFHQWLMGHGLIPKDNTAAKFPDPAYKNTYMNYPDPNFGKPRPSPFTS